MHISMSNKNVNEGWGCITFILNVIWGLYHISQCCVIYPAVANGMITLFMALPICQTLQRLFLNWVVCLGDGVVWLYRCSHLTICDFLLCSTLMWLAGCSRRVTILYTHPLPLFSEIRSLGQTRMFHRISLSMDDRAARFIGLQYHQV